MSGIMDFLGASSPSGSRGISGMSILMQAVGAAMRGESAQSFMKRLADQHPQLKEQNLENLQETAVKLCKERGINADDLAKEIDSVVDPVINSNK